MICDSLTASTRCHFCHTPVILTGRLSGEFKPDLIIPFATTREQAEQAFREYCKKKILLPRGFHSEAQIQNITPLYVPYWLKSGVVDARLDAEAKKIRTWQHGRHKIHQHKDIQRFALGGCRVRPVPCDGSRRIDDSMMEAIEPFNYTGLKKFSMSYLSGCGAEKYDVASDEASRRIDQRISDAAVDLLKSDIRGYSSVSEKSRHISFRSQTTVYGLLPVWFLNYTYRGKDYPFAMNGQTAPVSGSSRSAGCVSSCWVWLYSWGYPH